MHDHKIVKYSPIIVDVTVIAIKNDRVVLSDEVSKFELKN